MKIKSILGSHFVRQPGHLDRRFGDHYARISTSTTRKFKSAILDVARFRFGRGMIPGEISALTKRIPPPPQGVDDRKWLFGYEDDEGTHHKGLVDTDPATKEFVRKYPDLFRIVVKVLNLPRSLGQHPCGYIIASRPIKTFIPTEPINGVVCTQFTANSSDGISSVEGVGGVKYDYLKLNSLRDIQAAIKLIQERSGVEIPAFIQKNGRVPKVRVLPYEGELHDIWTSLPEDPEIFRQVSKGQTESVFQFNTAGAMRWLKFFDRVDQKGKPLIGSVSDMGTFTALDRPGPLDVELTNPDTEDKHNALVEFVRRATGQTPTKDIVEVFGLLFPETYGILVFQEQLQRAYQELTGCSGAEAEEFRSNVAKKRADKVAAAYTFFVERAGKTLGSKEVAAQVFQAFGTWSKYGFNKSHSISYALVAYITAFLKHHYPLEWWTAVLDNAEKNEIANRFWSQCGDYIDLPDMTDPKGSFTIINGRIQAPIGLLHGIGPAAQRQIVRYAPYKDLEDFCNKIQAHRELNSYIKTAEKTSAKGITKVVTTKVMGRSAIHSGIVAKLIISGAMDNLFEPGLTTVEKLQAFEVAIAKATGAKKVGAVKDEYLNLNAYDQFLIRKTLLPVYTQDLAALMVDCKHPRISTTYGRYEYKSLDGKFIPLWNLADLEAFEGGSQDVPYGGYQVAIPGYVATTRNFSFSSKEGCAVGLNVEGKIWEFVMWPDWNTGRLDPRFNSTLEKQIVVLTLVKRKYDKPFVIQHLEVLTASMTAAEDPA